MLANYAKERQVLLKHCRGANSHVPKFILEVVFWNSSIIKSLAMLVGYEFALEVSYRCSTP